MTRGMNTSKTRYIALLLSAILVIASIVVNPVITHAYDPTSILTSQLPATYDNDSPYELGTKFYTVTDGTISKVRLYTHASEGGAHVVRIWQISTGTVVAGPYTWSITSGTAGWKEYTLPTALSILANRDYIVSISNSSDQYYEASNGGFSSPISNGDLRTYTGSGVFSTTLGTMPTTTYGNSNYFRDVVFTSSGTVTPSDDSILNSVTPSSYGNDSRYELGTKFYSVTDGTISKVRLYTQAAEGGDHVVRIWRASTGTVVAGPYTWSITSGTAGWKEYTLPTALSILADRDYIVSISNSTDNYYVSSSNGFSSPINHGDLRTYTGSGVFSTTLGTMPTSVYGNSNYFRDVVFTSSGTVTPSDERIYTTQTPATYYNDARFELGTKFYTVNDGTITKVRLYTQALEGGDHVVRIWQASSGMVVAGPYTWSITSGTAGWKEYTLPTPLSIIANTDYIVSISNSTDNYYVTSSGGFSSPISNGDLRTYTGSGVYSATLGTMPTSVSSNSSYFRDVVFITSGSVAPTTNVIIPGDRLINWSKSGIPGGIPNRTIVCSTIAAGASQSTIQSALNACPANQVVKLSAGAYTLTDSLIIPSNVVLRGAGPQQTILHVQNLSTSTWKNGAIRFGAGVTPSITDSTQITAGSTAGSTSLTLQSMTGVAVGSYLMVTQLNDPSYVTISTANGDCTWCDGGIGWDGTRAQGQMVKVEAISGNTVTISPGLYVGYSNTPLATRVTMGATNVGVEDLQIYVDQSTDQDHGGYTANFLLDAVSYSWIKNVESNFTNGDHARLFWGYRNEIRDSYFHDSFSHTSGMTDADIFVANKTSGTLIENNVLRRLHQSVMLNWGAAGNVIAYNYIDGNFDEIGYNTLFGGLSVHGAHPMFNLWEGNIAPKLDADFYWGSSSHSVAFRNWFEGAAKVNPPLTGRGAEDPLNGFWVPYALAAVDLGQTVRNYSLVGNVIGSNRQKSLTWTPKVVAPQARSYYTSNNAYGYSFGYAGPSDGNSVVGDNSAPYTTAIIHGEYDYVMGTINWNSHITEYHLPSSLYQTSKPAWFGSLTWPAFGPSPTTPSTALVGNIPAKACYDMGKMPNCTP